MSIQTQETAIMEVLNGVNGLKTYDHEPKYLESLPCATLNYDRFTQRRAQFGEYEITYFWQLRLYHTLDDGKPDLDDVKTLTMEIINTFRAAPNLNGAALRCDITDGELTVVTEKQNPYYLHMFTVQVVEEQE